MRLWLQVERQGDVWVPPHEGSMWQIVAGLHRLMILTLTSHSVNLEGLP